jgi:hypothetical protein
MQQGESEVASRMPRLTLARDGETTKLSLKADEAPGSKLFSPSSYSIDWASG